MQKVLETSVRLVRVAFRVAPGREITLTCRQPVSDAKALVVALKKAGLEAWVYMD